MICTLFSTEDKKCFFNKKVDFKTEKVIKDIDSVQCLPIDNLLSHRRNPMPLYLRVFPRLENTDMLCVAVFHVTHLYNCNFITLLWDFCERRLK